MRSRRVGSVVLAGALLSATLVGQSAPPAAAADETISTRVDDADPVLAAITIAQLRFPDPATKRPDHVVVSRNDVFADSLSGTALLNQSPLLFTPPTVLSRATRDELTRLRAGAKMTAYVLGGPKAIDPKVASAIEDLGYTVVRLAGTNRIETSLAVAAEAQRLSGSREVFLARAWGLENSPGSGWVDSVAGGARAANNTVPVVLTGTAGLDPAAADWMKRAGITTTHLLGGPNALSEAVFTAAPGAKRHHGPERTATAAAIATNLWGVKATGPRSFTIVNGSQDRGWAFGLAAAGLAADRDAPVLLALDRITPSTRRMVATCGTPEVDLTLIGDGTLVSGAMREYLEDLDGQACGPDRTLNRRASLERFENCVDLIDWYRTNAAERVTAYGLDNWYGGGPMPLPATGPREESPTAAPQEGASDAGGQDVSGTNVQEVGVDEPDMLKTDGDLVAVVAQDGSVDLIDLTGVSPRMAANIPGPNQYGWTELLLTGDVLTTLTTNNNYAYFAEDRAFAPGQWAPATTTIRRWNVAAVDRPVLLSEFEADGTYRSARMIDGVARIVLESGPHDLAFEYPRDGSEQEHDRALAHNKKVVKESTLENWLPSWGNPRDKGAGKLLVDCGSVHQPPAWSGFDGVTVFTLDTRTDNEPGAAATVVAQGQNVYASLDRLLVTTGRWGESFEDEQVDSSVSTEIHAFDISSPTTIAYTGSGRVNGYVINQFALSEFKGSIRIAATTQPPWWCCGESPEQETESFVAVLQEDDGELAEVGRVGGLGRGERIQAVRFQGDLGIVVTFRQIDPLYLLDMASPTRPTVTGELKDTGFSRYLHRIGEDLLLGIGVDADEDGRTLGAMAALYDISDRSKPTRIDKFTLADSWSPVGDDHRAFLYWGATGDAFVPFSTYGEKYREIAAVLRVTPGASDPLARRGNLDHEGMAPDQQPSQIRRTFIVGSNVYSLSWDGLARHDLSTLATTSWTPFSSRDKNPDGGPV